MKKVTQPIAVATLSKAKPPAGILELHQVPYIRACMTLVRMIARSVTNVCPRASQAQSAPVRGPAADRVPLRGA